MGTTPFMLRPALEACFACGDSQCQDADGYVSRVYLQVTAVLALGTAGLIIGTRFAVIKERMLFEEKGKHHIELG